MRSLRSRASHAAGTAWLLVKRSVSEFFEDGCHQYAASVAYYALFAIFPIAILMVAGFGLIVSDDAARERVIEFVLSNVPLREDQGRERLAGILDSVTGSAGAFGIIGVLGLLFSASGLMASLRHAVNSAWHSEDRRPLLRGKAVDVLLVLAVGLLVTLSLGLTLTTRLFAEAGSDLEAAVGWELSLLPRLVLAAGQFIPFALAFLVFAALYRILPAAEVRLRQVWPAALAAAGGYELAKTAFSLYVENVANYSAVYGSIGAVIAFMLFTYIAAAIFLLGAEMASEWPRVLEERRAGGKAGEGQARRPPPVATAWRSSGAAR